MTLARPLSCSGYTVQDTGLKLDDLTPSRIEQADSADFSNLRCSILIQAAVLYCEQHSVCS